MITRGSIGLLVLAAALANACAPDPRTEIMLSIVTDLRAPVELAQVDLQVYDLDHPSSLPMVDLDWSISGDPDHPFKLPGSFGVYSKDGKPTRLKAVVTGRDPRGLELMHRSAIFSLVQGKTLFLRLGLTSTCMNNAGCGSDGTCVEGRCTALELDSNTFPLWKPGMDLQFPCWSGTRYSDTDTKQVLVDATAACPGGGTCRESTCFNRPPTDGGDEPPPAEAGTDALDAPQDLPADLAPADATDDGRDGADEMDAGPRETGASCSLDSQCLSAHCWQGVCCNEACNVFCTSCKLPGQLGTCLPAPANTPCMPKLCVGLQSPTEYLLPAYCTGTGSGCPMGATATCPDGGVCNTNTNECE